MAKWIIEEDDLVDEWLHHKCSSCEALAPFNYQYSEDYDEGMDGEWYSLGIVESGIYEYITPYCPNCGEEMDCSEAIHRIIGCKACVNYDEASCNYGYTAECSCCGEYPWASCELPSKWKMRNETNYLDL